MSVLTRIEAHIKAGRINNAMALVTMLSHACEDLIGILDEVEAEVREKHGAGTTCLTPEEFEDFELIKSLFVEASTRPTLTVVDGGKK